MEVAELFDICQQLAQEGPSASGLRRMHEVLVLTCAKGTKGQRGGFGNLFSQVDFVCKQQGMTMGDRVATQTLRRHSNQQEPPTIEEWRYDLRALTTLVSAVFKTDVPGSLRQLLPAHAQPPQADQHAEKCPYIRCIVRSWNQQLITATTDEGEISVDYGSTDGGRDLTYLFKMLREGMQLNLLDCKRQEGTGDGKTCWLPALIVVEPDFLVDISSIATCFTGYGHHPLLYTVNRLKPRSNTQAILLGNFAGTALDEVIKAPDATFQEQYENAIKRSFREQALRFCTCPGFDAERFKRDAALQLQNIRDVVAQFQILHSQFSILLEPSFVCERLGLQGRVDLMTSDMRLLVEQKAGKNMKIERKSHDAHGLQQENHYVQLLLYYGILRYNFGRSDQSTDIRLLYSHYPARDGLLTVNYYRTLFREAIRFRNQVVATELFIAREGFGRIIPMLTPAIIYKEVKPDSYFTSYVLPDLLQLNSIFSSLQPIERAYYERMMTFVYREQLYQKLGGAEARLHHSGGCASDLWQMSLTEKQESGNIMAGLRVTKREKSDPQGGYDLITLYSPDTGEPATLNFRRGDMVYLYAYRDTPDVRQSILYKGSIEELFMMGLTVRLNDGQQNADIFADDPARRWAVEHASSDLTASSNLRAIQQLICAEPQRKALLLSQRPPEADTSLQLSRSYSDTYDPLLLKVKQAKDYFLLVGPPGTGKTSQALRFMIAEELEEQRQRERHGYDQQAILITAYTNRAVDEICAMLSGEGWDYLRISNPSSCAPQYSDHLLDSLFDLHADQLSLRQVSDYIRSNPIIVGTTSMLQSRQEILELMSFSLCIVDEASQILEPSIIGLLAHPSVGRFVLVGDYKQLPAVVQADEEACRVEEPCLRDICLTDCRQSFFERLIRWEHHEGRSQFVGILNHQGRMHPEVAAFPCQHFYADEGIQPVPLKHQLEEALHYNAAAIDETDQLLQRHRVLFFDAPSPADEAKLVAALLVRIHRFYGKRFSAEQTVGVIVPYRNQIAVIRHEISLYGEPDLLNISIDTVERYQGSQRDVIIYSFTVSHRYQLDFLTANTFFEEVGKEGSSQRLIDRKLNVAMTRARCQLLMTGQTRILRHNPLFREIIDLYTPKNP